MTWGSLLYLISIFSTCALSAFLALYAWKYRQMPGSQAYSYLAFGQFLLAFFEIMLVFSPAQDQALFWFQLRYTSAAWIAVFWLLFALEYSGHKNWLSRPIFTALLVIPLGSQALLWTNSRHHLWAVQEVGLFQIGSLWIADLTARIAGPGFLAHIFFTVLLALFGVALMLLTAWNLRREFLGQALMLAGAGLTALVFTLNSLFHLLRPTVLNLFTPGMGLSVLLIAFAIYRFQFLKRSPAPRHNRLPAPEKQSLALIVLLFLILFSGITATAHISYTNYERNFRFQVDEQLIAIADLKVSGLANWRAERIGDAEFLQNNPTFAALVQVYFKNPAQTPAESQLQTWLDSLRNAYQYDRVFLLDSQGVERLASPITSGEPQFGDFYRNPTLNLVFLNISSLILDEENRPITELIENELWCIARTKGNLLYG